MWRCQLPLVVATHGKVELAHYLFFNKDPWLLARNSCKQIGLKGCASMRYSEVVWAVISILLSLFGTSCAGTSEVTDQARKQAVAKHQSCQVNADDIERQIRREVPLGSSASDIEKFLDYRRCDYRSDEKTHSITTIVRLSRESSRGRQTYLRLVFGLNKASKLESVNTNLIREVF